MLPVRPKSFPRWLGAVAGRLALTTGGFANAALRLGDARLPIFPLYCLSESIDRAIPACRNVIEELAGIIKTPRYRPVEHFPAASFVGHQTGSVQHLQVLHNSLSSHCRVFGQGS